MTQRWVESDLDLPGATPGAGFSLTGKPREGLSREFGVTGWGVFGYCMQKKERKGEAGRGETC